MIKKYFNFKSLALLESILLVDDNFYNIINILSKGGDKVSKSLIMLFDEDVKTNINYLKTSDKNDEIKFINDAQVKRIVDGGENPFNKTVNVIKVGRAIRQLFSANNLRIGDQDIENFVNLYKNAWDKKFTKMDGFRLVSGEDIRYWYLEDNYVNGGGQLNSSCMRYERCQPYLDIYVKNPDVCQLLIYVDKSNRLLGRALVWKLTDKPKNCDYFLDRIYTRFDNDSDKISEWFENHFNVKGGDYNSFPNSIRGCSVTIKNKDFNNYPYADTFWVLDWDDNKLLTFEARKYDRLQLQLQQTEGYANAPGYKRSKRMSKWIKSDDAIFCKYISDYVLISDCVKDRNGTNILKEDAVYSDYYDDYILKEDSVETEFGIVEKSDIQFVYDNIGDDNQPIDKKIVIKSSDDYRNYESTYINGSIYYMNKKLIAYSFDRAQYVLKSYPGNKLYNVYSNENRQVVNKRIGKYDCFGIYFKDNSFEHFIPYGIAIGVKKYYTESSLKMIGLDTSSREFIICGDTIYDMYSKSVKDKLVEYVRSLDINDDIKQAKLDEINQADSYLMRYNTMYASTQDFYRKIGNSSVLDYVNNILVGYFRKHVVRHFVEISTGYAKYVFSHKLDFQGYFSYYNTDGSVNDIDLSILQTEDDIKREIDKFVKLSSYEIYMFSYYFVLLNSKSNVQYLMKRILSHQKSGSEDQDSFLNIIGIIFHQIISHDFYDSICYICSEIRKDNPILIEMLIRDQNIRYDSFKSSYIDVFNNFYQKLF